MTLQIVFIAVGVLIAILFVAGIMAAGIGEEE